MPSVGQARRRRKTRAQIRSRAKEPVEWSKVVAAMDEADERREERVRRGETAFSDLSKEGRAPAGKVGWGRRAKPPVAGGYWPFWLAAARDPGRAEGGR